MKRYVERIDDCYFVAGTRVSLDSVVHAFWRGESPEAISQAFQALHLEDVYGAIAFYLAHQAEVDSYLTAGLESWEKERSSASPLPVSLRERLTRARHTTSFSREYGF